MRGSIPGFRFDSKRKVATFEVIVPGNSPERFVSGFCGAAEIPETQGSGRNELFSNSRRADGRHV